jgi:hypothetical protein
MVMAVSNCADTGGERKPPAEDEDDRSGQGEAGVYRGDGSTGPPDAGAEAGAYADGRQQEDAIIYDPWEGCGGSCPPEAPYCDPDTGRCFACRVGDPEYACPGSAPLCKVDEDNPDDLTGNACVECVAQSDCDALCDPATNQCAVCFVQEDGQSIGCDAKGEMSVCKTYSVGRRNRCVECVEDYDCESSTRGALCDPEDNRCVECLDDEHCIDPELPHCGEALVCTGCEGESNCAHLPETPLCDLDTGACVECLQNEQCVEPAASRCDASGSCMACADDDDCSHLQGTGVCDVDPEDGDKNRCVQCTHDDHSACSSYKDFVCQSLTRTCSTEYVVEGADVCDFCVSDEQCKPGMLCVLNTFGPDQTEVGYYCQWIEGAEGAPSSCSLDGRPFARTVTDAVSIDGQVATICVLAAATCPALAHAEFSLACDPDGDIREECGHPDLEDGVCVQVSAYDFQCSVPCDSVDDCPTGSASCATVNQEQVCEP